MKRHLFSIIKGSNQQKRRVLNESVSLDQDRSGGDNLSLNTLVTKGEKSSSESLEKGETLSILKGKLFAKLSKLEQKVLELYLQQRPYEEIAVLLSTTHPKKKYTKKSVDNALVRARTKAQEMAKQFNLFCE